MANKEEVIKFINSIDKNCKYWEKRALDLEKRISMIHENDPKNVIPYGLKNGAYSKEEIDMAYSKTLIYEGLRTHHSLNKDK